MSNLTHGKMLLSEFINEIEFLHKLSRREKRFIVKWFLFRMETSMMKDLNSEIDREILNFLQFLKRNPSIEAAKCDFFGTEGN